MEFAIRLLLYSAAGLVLVVANLWFVRSIYKDFLSSEFVIVPFNVIDPSGKATADKTGLALAQMMAARLADIQSQLKATQATVEQRPSVGDASRAFPVTALFVPRAVDIPTSLFQPVDIKVSVGGVEVGGIIAWLQRALSHERAIAFTTYERAEKVIISADLSNLTPGTRLWFESAKHPDDIATNAAFAILQSRLSDQQAGRIQALDLADFRTLLESIFLVDALNRRVAQGHLVEPEFVKLLTTIEGQLEKTPKWPELLYLAGSIAEGAHNIGKATLHYRKLHGLTDAERSGADARLTGLAAGRLAALGAEGDRGQAELQAGFVQASREFARKLRLAGTDPEVAFVRPEMEAIQATWNEKLKRMEVNPNNLATPGLPQYTALMGRFFARNFARCMGEGAASKPDSFAFWNEFRASTVDYLITSQSEFKDFKSMGLGHKLYRAFTEIGKVAGVENASRLVLELMNRFECDWSPGTITSEMIKINVERALMPEAAITSAMQKQDFAVPAART
jgi:hypothetical protein